MKYAGPLNKPITRKRIGLLADEPTYQAESRRITAEMFSKLPALFAAHGVNEGDWLALSIELAKAHVPGFKVHNPAGRKTEWGVADKAEFHCDVDSKSAELDLSVVESIKQVIRLAAWKDKAKPMTMAALEKHYYEAEPRWIQIVKDARAYESIVSTN
ncbi:MAG: hypothetical protein QFE16_01315 [Pseudomonadota bacterium]|nr:hypothetical protein [Pseudomonadota bacterium]